MIEKEIKTAVNGAVEKKQKTAMFHYQVLKNAEQLAGCDAKAFCKEVYGKESFATEFRKMLALAQLMKEQGATLISN